MPTHACSSECYRMANRSMTSFITDVQVYNLCPCWYGVCAKGIHILFFRCVQAGQDVWDRHRIAKRAYLNCSVIQQVLWFRFQSWLQKLPDDQHHLAATPIAGLCRKLFMQKPVTSTRMETTNSQGLKWRSIQNDIAALRHSTLNYPTRCEDFRMVCAVSSHHVVAIWFATLMGWKMMVIMCAQHSGIALKVLMWIELLPLPGGTTTNHQVDSETWTPCFMILTWMICPEWSVQGMRGNRKWRTLTTGHYPRK